ncbi:MAG: hypothetical protein AAF327_11160 [Cyanobacteria bacterium P01_A01_bin.37]
MKRATFTHENRIKTRSGQKTQTRRIGANPWKVQVGDVLALAEPTQFIREVSSTETTDGSVMWSRAKVFYPDTNEEKILTLIGASRKKLFARKDPYKPAIARFMLNDFARHYIRITDIREEHLRDISAEDAIAEGIEVNEDSRGCEKWFFSSLWNSIHKEPGKAWLDDPLVTAYTYQLLEEKPC